VVTVDLVVTVAIIGLLWFVIAAALAWSLRRPNPSDSVTDHLTAKTARWRPMPANRVVDKPVSRDRVA
jgi:hypothetical protein